MQKKGEIWSPRKIIRHLGAKLNDEGSVIFWCAKNDIPVMCPAFTDGFLG